MMKDKNEAKRMLQFSKRSKEKNNKVGKNRNKLTLLRLRVFL